MSNYTKDKDDRMTITVEKGEETISFKTDPDLHISEFRDLMMRLAGAVGYNQSNIEEYFLQDEEKSECCGAKYDKQEKLQRKKREAPSVDMGGNYNEHDDTFA
jgi:hypothetical protein